MQRNKSWAMRLGLMVIGSLFVGFGALVGCSAETDPDNPGTCKLSCSKKVVAAADYEVIALVQPPDAMTVACSEGDDDPNPGDGIAAISSPIQVRFQIFKRLSGAGGGAGGGSGSGGDDGGGDAGGAIHPSFPAMASRMPIAGVGFEPVLYGIMATEKTHPDLRSDATTATAGKFSGVETPPSEWCSDSCGVMTYEFRPACASGATNNVSAGLAVGAARSPTPVNISLTAP